MTASLAGDQAAYRRLLHALAPFLRAVVRSRARTLGLEQADVEDVVQETLLAIHLKRGTWDPGHPVGPWVAALLAEMGVPALVTLPAMYTDLYTGELTEPAELTDDQWTHLGDGHSELGRILREEHGVAQMFHPHADAHVDGNASIDRFLALTDPATVSLCLDTGHVAYVGGDNRAIVAAHPDRIGYVHLKSIDPVVLQKVRAEGMSFAQAVQEGAMVEPDRGEPEMPTLLAELNALGVPLTAIVEHDLYPAPPDAPLPIATRTHRYYTSCGLR